MAFSELLVLFKYNIIPKSFIASIFPFILPFIIKDPFFSQLLKSIFFESNLTIE